MRIAVFLFPAMLLAACDRQPSVIVRNASVEEVANELADAGTRRNGQFIRAGMWRSSVSIEDMEAPGMPPAAAEQIARMTGPTQTFESCLTEEQAVRPSEEFFAGRGRQCRYDHFKMGGGKIDSRMRCEEGGIRQVMELDGTYSPDSYDMRMTTSVEGAPGAAGEMRLRMRVEAERVGDCPAGQG
jgi:hypothetical protein